MSFKLRINPTFDQIAKRTKHVSSIRKLEDACDEAVFQYVHNPKPDRDKILDNLLAKAEEAMQFHIHEINKLDSKSDFDPTKEGASLVKKSRDKISNPDEMYKIQKKLNKEVVDSISIMADTMSNSAKKISETFVGKLFADIPLPEASKLRKASPLDHQATGNFRSNSMGYIGNKPPDPIQLELLKTQKAILHHLQNQNPPKNQTPEQHKEAENQNYPPSPATRKTQVLDKIEEHYRASVENNGNQLIRFKVFYKTEGVQKILKWGEKTLSVTVSGKTIADRMRAVNKEW